MDLFKLDKYDRIFIAFVLVIITLFNVSKCFASSEILPYSVNSWAVSGSTVVESSSRKIYQYSVTPNNKYNLITDGGTPQIIIRKDDGSIIDLGDNTVTLMTVSGLDNISFEVPEGVYYIGILTNNDNNMSLFLESTNYENAVNGLTDNVGISQLWGVFESGIDFVGVVVLVAFGLFLVFLLVKKISKGKADF